MTEHWVKDWSWNPAKELSRGDAEAHELYARVWVRDDGSVDRIEAYLKGSLQTVTYHGDRSDDEIAAFHTGHYPNVPRKQVRIIARAGAYSWKDMRSFDEHGTLLHRGTILSDGDGRELMQIDRGADLTATGISKYYWPDEDTLRFAFEYDPDGRRYSVWDLVENDHADFDYLAPDLPDAAFYADGWTLPAPIAGTPIPDDG